MKQATIYHNPKCSKSREALQILKDQCQSVEVIEYLKTPLDSQGLRELVHKLGVSPQQLLRRKEAIVQELDVDWDDPEATLKVMAEHPILMERPVVVCGNRAVIGRPTERVVELLNA